MPSLHKVMSSWGQLSTRCWTMPHKAPKVIVDVEMEWDLVTSKAVVNEALGGDFNVV